MKVRNLLLLAALAGSCSSEDQWRDTPVGLGNRIRIAVEGRDIPSIVTEDHFVYFVVDRPDGDPLPCRMLITETMSSDGASLAMRTVIGQKANGAALDGAESLPVSVLPIDQAQDVVLPEGWHLSLRQGDTFVFRVVDGQMVANDQVEVTLSATSEGNVSYLPASPAASPPLPRNGTPAGWPAPREKPL